MIRREDIEPPLDTYLYIYYGENNTKRLARWLKGSDGYDGWYLVDTNTIMSQSELKVTYFGIDGKKVKVYIPRNVMDKLFENRETISPETYDKVIIQLTCN